VQNTANSALAQLEVGALAEPFDAKTLLCRPSEVADLLED